MMRSLTSLLLVLTLGSRAVWCAPTTGCVAGPIAGTTCEAQCGVTHAGGDYASLPAASFQACANACSNDSRCRTAQFNKKSSYCYLKTIINQAVASSTVDTVVCRACAPEGFRVQVITPSGDVRYLVNSGEAYTPAQGGQTAASAYKSEASAYYLNGTMLTGVKPAANGARTVVYTWPGDGSTYAFTTSQEPNRDFGLLEVRLVQAVDKCNVLFRRVNGDTTPAIYQDTPGGGVAFFIQAANLMSNVPVKAVYAVPA